MFAIRNTLFLITLCILLFPASASSGESITTRDSSEASIVITLSDLGVPFGAIKNWEASLYAGAEVGSETGGRFSDWVTVSANEVRFTLPQDVRDGSSAPWGVADDAYVRIRSGAGEYPTFDLVSDAFTLNAGNYSVHIDVESMNQTTPGQAGAAVVTARLDDLGGDFGAPGAWEVSLYAGAEAGSETGGRFTDWMPVNGCCIDFTLPADVRDGSSAPWDDDAYIRVRPVDRETAYPQFDLVGRPFTLTDGEDVTSTLQLSRAAAEGWSQIMVSVRDLGSAFGAIQGWEASLYAGAEIGSETGGRFTDWVEIGERCQVPFQLPDALREGRSAPWAVPNDTYVRIRSGADQYPTFDLVSDPFTLKEPRHRILFQLDGRNEESDGSADRAVVTARLDDLGGDFGAPGAWEVSLYAGAEAGSETGGRFTDWMPVNGCCIDFTLPADVRDGSSAPWDDDAYIRVRPVDRETAYPQFDLVGRPFTLTQGKAITSSLTLERGTSDERASVLVTLSDLGLDSEFGAIKNWEASLYAGAESGSETGGRFTDWFRINSDGRVLFSLPLDVREGRVAPWEDVNNTYVRIRSGAGEYPTFDLVSDAFTLDAGSYHTHFDLRSAYRIVPGTPNQSTIRVHLNDLGGNFGKPTAWEASLYAGAEAGSETGGRFTAWVQVGADGYIDFTLPADVRDGSSAPWNDHAYIRVRPVDRENAYPQFDLVGQPFLLLSGSDIGTGLQLSRMNPESEVPPLTPPTPPAPLPPTPPPPVTSLGDATPIPTLSTWAVMLLSLLLLFALLRSNARVRLLNR